MRRNIQSSLRLSRAKKRGRAPSFLSLVFFVPKVQFKKSLIFFSEFQNLWSALRSLYAFWRQRRPNLNTNCFKHCYYQNQTQKKLNMQHPVWTLCIYIYIYIYQTYIHTYIHTYIYIYIYMAGSLYTLLPFALELMAGFVLSNGFPVISWN